MNKKRILLVYPHNFLQGLHGTNMNIYQLTKVFKELNYNIDLFAYEGFTPDSDFSDFEDQNKEKLIDKLYVYDFRKSKKINKVSVINKIKNKTTSEKKILTWILIHEILWPIKSLHNDNKNTSSQWVCSSETVQIQVIMLHYVYINGS